MSQDPKTTTIDDRLLVVAYPGILDASSREYIRAAMTQRVESLGLEVIVLDAGAEVYRPSLLGQVSLQLSALESQVAALSDMVERVVAALEDEGDPEPGLTLDGEPGGKPREPGAPL